MMDEQISKENEDVCERLILAISSAGQNAKISKAFSNLPTTVQKVDFILELLSRYNISVKFIKDCKNDEKSTDLRIKGNEFYLLKNDEMALEMYTYSIAFAENESRNLALAYANRSAVFFRLGFFEECLSDIQRALQNNYPDFIRDKIIDRQEKAQKLISKQIKMQYHQPVPSINKNDFNPLINCASKSVEIKIDPKQGRYLVATRDIEIGEIIAVESPTFSILTDSKWCHCYHCLNLCYCVLPCESCTKVLFCSISCRDKASSYHTFECPILSSIASLGYNSCRYLPLRIAILMTDCYQEFEEENNSSDNVYMSGRYKEIHDLVTNEMVRKPTDIFERVTCTALYYLLLKDHTNFFEKNANFKETFVQLIFHHLQTMSCNFHDIHELCFQNSSGLYESSTIGAGAYSVLSLFNHSCSPNVSRTTYGTTISVYAMEKIKKGQQLFDDYGFHFALHPKSLRQAKLKKQYFFDCECEACKNDWDILLNLKQSNEPLPFIDYIEDLGNANLQVAREVRPAVIEALKRSEKNMPCLELCHLQEIFKQCDQIFGSVRRSL